MFANYNDKLSFNSFYQKLNEGSGFFEKVKFKKSSKKVKPNSFELGFKIM